MKGSLSNKNLYSWLFEQEFFGLLAANPAAQVCQQFRLCVADVVCYLYCKLSLLKCIFMSVKLAVDSAKLQPYHRLESKTAQGKGHRQALTFFDIIKACLETQAALFQLS